MISPLKSEKIHNEKKEWKCHNQNIRMLILGKGETEKKTK